MHNLNLKIGAPVILLRTLSILNGLCNGTRMKIIELYEFNIKVMILSGISKGETVFIPRILLDSQNSSLPYTLNRRKFPIAWSYAITINKSQGQSFDYVGLYYKKLLFSHGQLYVALSRCKNPDNLFIQNASLNDNIENILLPEVLE